jgi:hypothetical protein
LSLFDDAPPLNRSKYALGKYISNANVKHIISPVVLISAGGKVISILECLDFSGFGHFYNNRSQFIIIFVFN